jgi:hypothetical protein
MTSQPPALKIGSALARSFGIWGRNFVPFTILTLLVEVPVIAFAWWCPVSSWGMFILYTFVVLLAPSFLGMVAAGAIAYGVFKEIQGERASLGQCVAVGVSRLFRVVGVAVAVFSVIGLWIGVALFTAVLVMVSARDLVGPNVMLAVFGFFSIPAVAMLCRYWVVVPCAVVEQNGVFGALRRSAFLTRGARVRIFGVIVLLAVLGFGAGWAVKKVLPDLAVEKPVRYEEWSADTDEGYAEWQRARFAALAEAQRLDHVGALLMNSILSGLSSVVVVVVYYGLRLQKEHVDIDRIADVFA